MNITYLRMVRKLFTGSWTCRRVERHNMRQWVQSVRHLGGHWVCLK